MTYILIFIIPIAFFLAIFFTIEAIDKKKRKQKRSANTLYEFSNY